MITITSYLGWSSRASASIVSPRTSCSWRAGNSNENDRGAPAARRRKPVAANASGLRHACSIHHRVVLETVNNPSDRTTSTPLRRSCAHDSGRFSLCSGGIGCAGGSVPPENACTPWAGGSAPPDEPSGCRPGVPGETGAGCSVAADDPSPLAEGTDGCAGWSPPPKGPTEDHYRDEEENGSERHSSPLDAEPPRICLANSHRFVQWSSVCRLGRRGGAQGLTAPSEVAQRCQTVVRGEPRHRRARAPAPLRAVQQRSAVSAAAVEPKAQRAPYPDPVAQCCQHPDRSARA